MKITKKKNLKKKTQKHKKYFKNKTQYYKKNIKNNKYKNNITQRGYGKQERERADRQRREREREYIRSQQEIKQRSRNTFINLFQIRNNKLKLNKEIYNKLINNQYISFSNNQQLAIKKLIICCQKHIIH